MQKLLVRDLMFVTILGAAGLAASAASAQEAGETLVRISEGRTKLVDKGDVYVNGVKDPAAGYSTRATRALTFGLSHFVLDRVALDASISSPQTTNNIPAGSLAGTPNLGDDEFVIVTLGASVHPIKGPVSPYVGGGLQLQFTAQQRDGLAVGLDVANSHGPYVNAGIDFRLNDRLGLFIDGRKAFYSANATGKLPLDATYTSFADVYARAQLDPFTVSIGLTAKIGGPDSGSEPSEDTDSSPRFVLKLGYSNLELADRVDLMVGGAPFPGADISTFEHQTPSVQFAWFLTPNVALNATLGLPPHIDIYGGGTIGALPKLGEITYGPTAWTVQYHFNPHGRIQPYVGAGVSYMLTFSTKDGAFEDLKVSDDLAPAFGAGVNFKVTGRWGIFADVKKALLRPTAYGSFMGADVVGKTRLDPWVFTGGISFGF